MQSKSEFAELLTLKPIRWQFRSGKQAKVVPVSSVQTESDRVYAANAVIADEIKQRRGKEQAPDIDRLSFGQLEEMQEQKRLASGK